MILNSNEAVFSKTLENFLKGKGHEPSLEFSRSESNLLKVNKYETKSQFSKFYIFQANIEMVNSMLYVAKCVHVNVILVETLVARMRGWNEFRLHLDS